MTVAQDYPPMTDSNGMTWYRPALEGRAAQMWGWTSDPQQAHPSYQADPPRPLSPTERNTRP